MAIDLLHNYTYLNTQKLHPKPPRRFSFETHAAVEGLAELAAFWWVFEQESFQLQEGLIR